MGLYQSNAFIFTFPGVGQWPSPGCIYACYGKTPKGCNGANPNGWAQIGEHGIKHGTWKQKAYTRTDTNTYKKWWEPQLWKRDLRVKDPWHNWHRPEELSETEVAAVTQWQGHQHLPRVPQCQWWWQSHIMLTWHCWKSHQWGAHGNSCEERWRTGANNSHRRSSGHSIAVVAEAWDIMKKLQRKGTSQQHEA